MLADLIYDPKEIRVAIFESRFILPSAKHKALMTLFKYENGFSYTKEEMNILNQLLLFLNIDLED